MIPKFFGQFLLERRIIDVGQLTRAIKYQEEQKLRLGELAVREGYMTQAEVDQIRNAQKSTDKYFGEIAVEKLILTTDQLKKLITLQKNSHVYLGESLVHLGILSQDEIKKQLDNFKEDQKDIDQQEIKVTINHPKKEYFFHFVDLTVKLLRRVAGVEAKVGDMQVEKEKAATNYITSIIEFSEDLSLKFAIGLNEKVAKLIAREFLEEEIEDVGMITENAGEFLNIVCGNISTKLQILGLKTQISVPKLIKNTEMDEIAFQPNEKALHFPLVTTDGNCEVLLIIKDIDSAQAGNKKRVLIVDDSRSVAYKLTKIVDRLTDFEVIGHAQNGKDALAMFKELKPDLVTMDIVLPDKTGLEVIKDIKAVDADANIVVISSVGGGQDKLFEAIQSGAKNVIVKPFDENTVREIFIQSV